MTPAQIGKTLHDMYELKLKYEIAEKHIATAENAGIYQLTSTIAASINVDRVDFFPIVPVTYDDLESSVFEEFDELLTDSSIVDEGTPV